MSKEHDLTHRNYYYDHPTSISHREKYIIPLENQYSILNRSRNPYQMFDQLSTQINYLRKNDSKVKAGPRKQIQSEELKLWEKRQLQKQDTTRAMQSEVKNLSYLIKLKEMQYQIQKLARVNNNKSSVIPFPMYMPMMGDMSFIGRNCRCCCSSNYNYNSDCNNNCNCKHQCPSIQRQEIKQKKQKKYRPIITENSVVEAEESRKILKVPSEKLPSIPRISKLSSCNQSIKKLQALPLSMPIKIPRPPQLKKKNLLRRWRICTYAIYFCIYFKWFSLQFSINRYTNFKAKYLMDEGRALVQTYKQVYDKLLRLDICSLVRKAATKVKQTPSKSTFDVKSLLKSQSAKNLKSQSKWTLLTSNREVLFLRCGQFAGDLLDEVGAVINKWDWGEVGYGLGVGSLNQSFVIDNIFLPHQICLMNFHNEKGYMKISSQCEKILVMTKFIIKLLLFNTCLQLDNNKEWSQLYREELELREDTDEVFAFLEISSKILYILCQKMYQNALNGHLTNYGQMSDKFQIEPCNPLVYSFSIKKRRELFQNEDIKESNLLIYGIDKLDQVNQIMEQDFFKKMEKSIIGKTDNLLSNILQKLKQFNKQIYHQIREETLKNEYIILRGLKKIMRPNRYYPFTSATVAATQITAKTLQNNKQNKSQKKKSQKQSSSKKLVSNRTKISIENNMQS